MLLSLIDKWVYEQLVESQTQIYNGNNAIIGDKPCSGRSVYQ